MNTTMEAAPRIAAPTDEASVDDLKRSAFYPVNMDTRTIILYPRQRERDVAWLFKGTPGVIGMRGAHLRSHPLYRSFKLVPKEPAGC